MLWSAKKTSLFILSALLFLSFIFLSYLVAKGRFTHPDFDLTVKFQDHIPHKFDLPFSILSLIGTVEITGFGWLILTIVCLVKRFWLTTLGMFLLPLALAIELYGKLYVHHPAPPYLFYRGVIKFTFLPSNYIQTDYSYPSGHVTRTAFLITFLMAWFYLKASPAKQLIFQISLGVFLVLMMVSRIYLGEHWTSDVIGGFLIGSSFGLLASLGIPKTKTN